MVNGLLNKNKKKNQEVIQQLQTDARQQIDQAGNTLWVLKRFATVEQLFDALYRQDVKLNKTERRRVQAFSQHLNYRLGSRLDRELELRMKLQGLHRIKLETVAVNGELPWIRSRVTQVARVPIGDAVYRVVLEMVPAFAKNEGQDWQWPLRIHHHQRMLVRVLSIINETNPLVSVVLSRVGLTAGMVASHDHWRLSDDGLGVIAPLKELDLAALAPSSFRLLPWYDVKGQVRLINAFGFWHHDLWDQWLDEMLFKTKLVARALQLVMIRRLYLRVFNYVSEHGLVPAKELNQLTNLDQPQLVRPVTLRVEPENDNHYLMDRLRHSDNLRSQISQFSNILSHEYDGLLTGIFGVPKIKWHQWQWLK